MREIKCDCIHETQQAIVWHEMPALRCSKCGGIHLMDGEDVNDMDDEREDMTILIVAVGVILLALVACAYWVAMS